MKANLYEIETTEEFDKQAIYFLKKKRYFSLTKQIEQIRDKFAKGKFEGELIKRGEGLNPPHNVYKLRLANPDANVGKSGGYRVYYLVATLYKIVVLLCIYSKKEYADMPEIYISDLIDGCLLEIADEGY
ncbi:MAG: hypothetical protein LBE35_02275 [Clostridiales bacterium]|jgi:mRNA-degrading endonuclease RelE of RelBE toxin-antitoxin system|nr:hypothetical protein [Clostridiales bacterium]